MKKWILCLLFLFTPLAWADNPAWVNLFQQGVAEEEKGNYRAARRLYERGLREKHAFPADAYFQWKLGVMHWEGRGGFRKNRKRGYDLMINARSNGVLDEPELTYYLGEKAERDGDHIVAALYKSHSALQSHQRAYDDLPNTLRKLLTQKKLFADSEITPWQGHMLEMAASYLDYQIPTGFQLEWAVAFEHGIGVPKNRVVAQAIYLAMDKSIAQADKALLKEAKINPHTIWAELQNLSPTQKQAAETLFTQIWAMTKPAPADRYEIGSSRVVFDTLLKYAQDNPETGE